MMNRVQMKNNESSGIKQPNIAAQIRFKEALLEYVLSLQNHHRNRSDMGWLMTIAANDIGTLLAVLGGKNARKYGDIIRKLERDIILLKVEERLRLAQLES